MATFEQLDDAVAGQVQVIARVAVGAVREAVQREGEHEGAIDALGGEDLQQLAQVGRLAGLVADVRTVHSNGRAGIRVVLDDLWALGAAVTGAAAGCRTEFRDGDRLALRDEGAVTFLEVVGDHDGAAEIDSHAIEGRPVDPLERFGGKITYAAEPFSHECHRLATNVVDTGAGLDDPLTAAIWLAEQYPDPLGERVL